jgi:ribosomal protein S27AE
MNYDEKPKRQESAYNLRNRPCPICGGEEFVWGRTSRSDAGWLGFKANDHPMLTPGREVGARECQRCGNVQLFTLERG